MRCWRVISSTSRTVIVGETVIGSLHHAAFEALDLGHLGGLRLRRQVLVDDADAAFLRQRDGQARLGHRVHGGGKQRQVERNRARQAGGEADVAGQDRGMGGNEQDVVERQRFLQNAHGL